LFQEIYNERSSLPLTLPISFVKYLAIDLADFKELSSLANSRREALNIMLISSKKVLHVVRVLHVLPDIFQREAPSRYPSPFPPFPDDWRADECRGN
jgi:hypothetical protein